MIRLSLGCKTTCCIYIIITVTVNLNHIAITVDILRSFSVAGPRVWNSLPAHLRDEEISYNSFRRELKTYWFRGDRGAM